MSDVLHKLRVMEHEAIEELQALEAQIAHRMRAPLQQLVGKRLRVRLGPAYSDPGAGCEVLRGRFEADEDGSYECWLDVRFDGRNWEDTVPLRRVVEML